jgi:hypothetical protein
MWRLQDALSESHGSAVPPPPPLPSLETSILKENLASLEERVNTVRTDRRTDAPIAANAVALSAEWLACCWRARMSPLAVPHTSSGCHGLQCSGR